MAEEIDPSVLKKTQEILGSVIKRPALTEKNLKRPPFRFIHDIITSLTKTTGFLKGLYSPEEMVSDNIKDKELRLAYLQKAIDVLSIITNQPVILKPAKVVAGHEVQKTNEFLQILGHAAKDKLDYKEAVQAVLGSSSNASSSQKERRVSVDKRSKNTSEKTRSIIKADGGRKVSNQNAAGESSRGSDKTRSRSKDSKTREKEKLKDKSRSKRDDSKSRDKPDAKKDKSSRRHKEPKAAIGTKSERLPVEEEIVPNGHIEHEVPLEHEVMRYSITGESQMVNGESLMEAALSLDGLHDAKIDDTDTISPKKEPMQKAPSGHVSRPPSGHVSRPPSGHVSRPPSGHVSRPPSDHVSRPPSARNKRTKPGVESEESKPEEIAPSESVAYALQPADTHVRDVELPLSRPSSARPSSSRPAPPRIRIRHIVENDEPRPPTAKPATENVILYPTQQSEDEEEEETFVVAEEPPMELQPPEPPASVLEATPEEDKGSLVKQLLETKKDLEGGSQQIKKTEIDKSQMSTAAAHRAREASNKELEQLRVFIQSVSKTANPLGKMLDYLQEDVDSMKMELKMWKEEHKENLIALKREKNITETTLEPLRVQLDDFDQVVQDQLDANSALKATILRNDERIQRMLAGLRRKS